MLRERRSWAWCWAALIGGGLALAEAHADAVAFPALCARPASPDEAALCRSAALRQPAALENIAERLAALGRYDDAAAAENDALASRRQGGGAPLAHDLARLALLERQAGHYTAAATASIEASALAAKPDGMAALPLADRAAGEVAAATGHYAAAEVLLRRSLGETEKASGAASPDVAEVLEALADLLGDDGKLVEAEADIRRAVAIRGATAGPAGAATAHAEVTLALLLLAKGDVRGADALATQSVLALRKALGPQHPDVADALNAIGVVYRAEGRYNDAEAVTIAALRIRVADFEAPSPLVATSANNLALMMEQEGKLAEAEALFRKVIALRLAVLGPDHPDLGGTYNNLGGLMRVLGRMGEAERFYREALRIEVAALGPQHPDVATGLANLALVIRQEGRFALAEAMLRRALAIRQAALPPDHPDIASTLVNLGEVFTAEGRAPDAEAAFRRALQIQEKVLGLDHPSVAATLNNLAALYREENRYGDAELLYKQALTIEQKVYPPGHPEIANTIGNLADLYAAEGKLADADRLQQAALQLRIKAFGPDHPIVATSLNNLALLRRLQGKTAEAEALLRRVLAMRIAAFGEDHPDVAGTYNNLAEVLAVEHKTNDALDAMRKATAIYQARAAEGEEANSAAADAERKAARFAFINHVNLLADAQEKATGPVRDALVAESFAVSQLAQNWGVGAVVAQMAARLAAGTGDLARLVRDEQDTQEQWRKIDAILVKAALQPAGTQNVAEAEALRMQREKLAQHVRDLDVTIRQKFPAYAEAVSLNPVTLATVQKLLLPQEAIVSYLIADQGTFIWVVRRDRAMLVHSQLPQDDFAAVVRQLRQGLDPAKLAETGVMPVYDTGLAYRLYQQIVAPISGALSGTERVLVVADGPLQSLPLGVLVASPPSKPKPGAAPDYRQVDWLVRHYAVAMLPSISSLRALRVFAHGGVEAPQPFIGIGDPLLGGPRLRSRAIISDGVDVKLVRDLVPLPETANELRAIATTLKAPDDDVITTGRATRTRVLDLPLTNYRVVAFATHGLLTGELKGLTEPALVLTPDITLPGDNGLLLASQIAEMHFNADWVVLSACNTAASDGSVGAEGLSGLAKAFFYAGTRALLVSHWPVNSAASVQLTTTAVGLMASTPGLGKAEALQRSEMKLLDKGQPFFSHPMMWAPFIVVGEGSPQS